jgi:hypothetical protein
MHVLDLTGKTFAKLKVIAFSGRSNKDRRRLWNCKCECGNTTVLSSHELVSGNTKSCGCLQHKKNDLTGMRFSKLYVEEPSRSKLNGRSLWRCKCDCGKSIDVLGSDLEGNRRGSCGCSVRAAHWKGYQDIDMTYFNGVRNRAKRKGYEFSITIEEVWEVLKKQEFKCVLSGLPISIKKNKDGRTASLDRIDSSKGYISNNVQWLHKHVNKMKLNYKETYFIDLGRQIVKTCKKK